MSLSAQAPKQWKAAPHAGPAVPHSHADAIVVGGGASGVLMAFHLLRETPSDFRVTLIEKNPPIGRGIAYGTANAEHLLNARIAFMSALRDEPDHFRQWLCAHPDNASADRQDTIDPSGFAPRPVYGDYLQSLIEPFAAPARGPARLQIIRGECRTIDESRSGVAAILTDGSRHTADIAILATGHDVRPKSGGCYVDPWTPPAEPAVKRDARVLIVGTGLTMVDYVLSLEAAGHQGPIVAMSRHGLLPRPERKHDMLAIHPADIPFGAGPADLLRWQRNLVEKHVADGGDWRGVIDGLRPFNQQIWRGLSASARRTFMRHARAWWNVHRHRMPPQIHARISAATASGRLRIVAASVCGVEQNASGATVRYRPRHMTDVETLQVDVIVECRGMVSRPTETANPVLSGLLESGRARPDTLCIGLDVTPDGAIVDCNGTASERLFAVGPLARAAFWEITAVPEIRGQCADLAGRITRTRLRRTA